MTMTRRICLLACASSVSIADAFVSIPSKGIRNLKPSSVERKALWRHWIPEADFLQDASSRDADEDDSTAASPPPPQQEQGLFPWNDNVRNLYFSSLLAATILMLTPSAGIAVSGGGLDYANLDITGQDFSNQNYKGKDFTQVIAKGTNFAKSNLQGCRFYKAYLVNADFSGADIRGASLEDTSMDGASLTGALAAGSYFSNSIIDAASVENADFTDAQFPMKTLPLLCMRDDMKGTNPVTGVDTRDSAMCP